MGLGDFFRRLWTGREQTDYSWVDETGAAPVDNNNNNRGFGFLSRSSRTSLKAEGNGNTILNAPSGFEIACMTSFNFPFGAICCSMGTALLPLESERLFPDNAPVALGAMMGIVGVSQLICPIAGKISDNHRSEKGKRRPYIHVGNLVSVVCVGLMTYASSERIPWLYVTGLFIAMLALNTAFSAAGGLVPDLVPAEVQGKSSGIVGLHQLAGAVSGFVFLIATHKMDHKYNYYFFCFLLGLSSLSIQWKAKEESSINMPKEELKIADFLKTFSIDTSKGNDFLHVFNARTLYYVAVSCQSFFLYYIRDIIHVNDQDTQKFHLGALGILGQACGALVTVPVGKISDGDFGRKKLVYFSCGVMMFVYIGFIVISLLDEPYDLIGMYSLMVVYGCGNGAFLSVDYAIALDCIPDKTKTAQSLGTWGVAAFLGLAIGPIIWGAILQVSIWIAPPAVPGSYPAFGYFTMLVVGCFAVFLAGKCIHHIRCVR